LPPVATAGRFDPLVDLVDFIVARAEQPLVVAA
jgi:hypothetical protein